MSNEINRTALFIIGGVFLLLGLLYFFGGKKKLKYNWEESYNLKSTEPYGLDLFEKLLENYSSQGEFHRVEEKLDKVFDGSEINANYVLIGQAFLMQEEEIYDLLDFVYQGNTAFFSCKSIPFDFLSSTITEPCYYLGLDDFQYSYSIYDSAVKVNFEHPNLSSDDYELEYWRNGKVKSEHQWTFISEEMLCDSFISPIKIGTVDEQMNFMKINHGNGEIFLHSTPLTFTNFHIKKEKNLEYVEKVLSHLNSGDIYWDAEHHISEAVSRRRNAINTGNPNNSPQQFQETPLKYILSQPPLAWAWYTLIGMTLLYLVFSAKRRQRIIPVTEPVTNTSLEFIDTIGKLHFQRGNPRQVIFQKMKYLQNFIKNRYGLPVQDWNAEFIKKLKLKSEVPTDLLEKIQIMHHNVTTSRYASNNTLMDFHKLVEEFYRLKK